MDEQQRQSAGGAESAGAAGTEQAGKGEQWVVTFGESGEVTRIEKIDAQSGERQELSEEEYAAVAGWDMSGDWDYWEYYAPEMSGMEDYAGYGAYDPSYYDPSYEEAYYQGVSDAMEAGYGMSGLTAEEAAYYQGMEDYMTYCM